MDYERHHLSRRFGNSPISTYKGNIKATVAYIRQADDLLPNVGSDERGDSGYFDHLDSSGYPAL